MTRINYGKKVLLIVLLVCIISNLASAQPFRFTVSVDNRPYASDNLSRWEWLLDEMTINVVDEGAFHIMPGDFDDPQTTNASLITQFGSDVIWYPVVGNHEAETPADMTWIRNAYPTLPNIVNQGPEGCLTTTYSFNYGNAHFVAINEYYDGTSDVGTDGDVVDELYNWLVADLDANTRPVVFVIGHEPAYPEYRHIGDSMDKYPVRRDRFWKLLNDKKVIAYFCGHTHTYYRKQVDGDWDLFTWQVDAGNAGNPGEDCQTFVDVTVTETDVTFNTWRGVENSSFSMTDSWTVDIPSVPSPPSNLTATAVSASRIDLAWVDNSTNEDGFNIERSLNGIDYTLLNSVAADVTTYSDNGLAPSTKYYYEVYAHNTNGNSDNARPSATTPAEGNQPPIADAGPDQTVSDGDDNGEETVTLDGLASSDPDGTIDSYEWKEGATTLGTTASITVPFSVGTHTITLTVTDNEEATASDNVDVTVNANQAPTANAGSDQTVSDGDGNSEETVTLDGSASSDPDGSITAYEWKEGATTLGTTASITTDFTVGVHTVTLTVTDNGGSTASDDVDVTVNAYQQPATHVDDIVVEDIKVRSSYKGRAEVVILDESVAAVSGATVYGTFSGDIGESVEATTDGNGLALLETALIKKKDLSITFCIDSVVHATLPYDAGANVETCDTNY